MHIMKKMIVFLLLTFSLSLFGAELKLSDKLLKSSEWKGLLLRMNFSNNNKVVIADVYDGTYFEYHGTYLINKNTLQITYELNMEKSHLALVENPEKHKFYSEFELNKIDDNNIEVRNILTLSKFENKSNSDSKLVTDHKEKISNLLAVDFYLKPGDEKKIGKYNFFILKQYNAITTVNLKYRSAPFPKAKSYTYFINFKEYPFLPKNTQIIVLARTKEKVMVQDMQNYWYYIDIADNSVNDGMDFTHPFDSFGFWVFGEFITKKE